MANFSTIKKRQWYVLGALLTGLACVGIIFWGVATRETYKKPQRSLKSSLVTGTQRINPQEVWVYQFKTEADLVKKRLDAMETSLGKLIKSQEDKQTVKPHQEISHSSQHSLDALKELNASIQNIRQELKASQNSSTPEPDKKSNPATQVLPPPPQPLPSKTESSQDSSHSTFPFRSKTIRKITLALKDRRSFKALKSVDTTVPAGAFARAVLLGGVDASASIQASSDPRPALLRLVDGGTLPRKFHSDLKGCHVLAACYGDISSERVFMRLEKLTCTERKTGEIIEVKAQGYVAGEDGRTGVRGSVVDRAGESMRRVLLGGFLGGIGEFLSQSSNTAVFSPMAGLGQSGGIFQQKQMGIKDALQHGAGKGVNNALDKYADFYIKRAEQLQPVIQVAAGRQVDIVFTEGVSIGNSAYRQALGLSNDQERYQQIRSLQDPHPLEGKPLGATSLDENPLGGHEHIGGNHHGS